jgi:hypothetical protein
VVEVDVVVADIVVPVEGAVVVVDVVVGLVVAAATKQAELVLDRSLNWSTRSICQIAGQTRSRVAIW